MFALTAIMHCHRCILHHSIRRRPPPLPLQSRNLIRICYTTTTALPSNDIDRWWGRSVPLVLQVRLSILLLPHSQCFPSVVSMKYPAVRIASATLTTSSSNFKNEGTDRSTRTRTNTTTGRSTSRNDGRDTRKVKRDDNLINKSDKADTKHYDDDDDADINFDHDVEYPDLKYLQFFLDEPLLSQNSPSYETSRKAKTRKAKSSSSSALSFDTTENTKEDTRSIRQQMDDEIQRAYNNRMAQKDIFHQDCRTCPICQCEYFGGRYIMLDHLLNSDKCTKEVPTDILTQLIEQKELADRVKNDDIVVKDKRPEKNKKTMTQSESNKLHRKKAKKRNG